MSVPAITPETKMLAIPPNRARRHDNCRIQVPPWTRPTIDFSVWDTFCFRKRDIDLCSTPHLETNKSLQFAFRLFQNSSERLRFKKTLETAEK
jgi:hypothetical protein